MSQAAAHSTSRSIPRRRVFALGVAASVLLFWKPLELLLRLALTNDSASQILLMPAVSALLIYLESRRIFREARPAYRAGGAVIAAGILGYGLAAELTAGLNSNDLLSARVPAIVLVWIGVFLLCYGPKSARAAAFPLGILFLMIPIPTGALNTAIVWLQSGSTAISQWLFQLARVPVLREGFVLALPSVTIEVAKECSGIRSSLALLITCLIASYLFLRSGWKRAFFVLVALPFSIVKNGIRIVTLCLLAMYVNPGFLTGRLHHEGGIVFFLLTLLLLAPILFALQRSERRPNKAGHTAGPATPRRKDARHDHGVGTVAPTSFE